MLRRGSIQRKLALAAALAFAAGMPSRAEAKLQLRRGEAPKAPTKEAAMTEKAVFAAGCFWGVQSAFDEVKGVKSTTVGYTGGHTKNPSYEEVCTHTTGHAEAVEVEYDPAVASYEKLVEYFFKINDPTTKNRQGPDVGDQYRSAIFSHTPQQQATAEAVKARLAKGGRFKRPIVTEITPASTFYPAEEYHQKYFQKHKGAVQCHINL